MKLKCLATHKYMFPHTTRNYAQLHFMPCAVVLRNHEELGPITESITSEDRFKTVGGTPVAKRANPLDTKRRFLRATYFQSPASGPKQLK